MLTYSSFGLPFRYPSRGGFALGSAGERRLPSYEHALAARLVYLVTYEFLGVTRVWRWDEGAHDTGVLRLPWEV